MIMIINISHLLILLSHAVVFRMMSGSPLQEIMTLNDIANKLNTTSESLRFIYECKEIDFASISRLPVKAEITVFRSREKRIRIIEQEFPSFFFSWFGPRRKSYYISISEETTLEDIF
eukprot:UN22514